MKSASSTMSLFSLNSCCQPPLTFFFSAIELRLSPLTTLYSPSPFLTFLPVGVETVFSAAGRDAEREAAVSVERVAVLVLGELFDEELFEEDEVDGALAPPVYAAPDRPVPQVGQAPL